MFASIDGSISEEAGDRWIEIRSPICGHIFREVLGNADYQFSRCIISVKSKMLAKTSLIYS